MSREELEGSENTSAQVISNENEIFKSLSHQIRRNIIKALGNQKELTFTEIKNEFTNIDSPTLAYHLKSLKLLITQNQDIYTLSDIGQTALLLMDKIDQSDRLKKMKKNFWWANAITSTCWIIVQIFIPVTLSFDLTLANKIFIIIILNVFPQISYQYMWRLYANSFSYNPGKGKNRKKQNIETKGTNE